MKMDLQFNICFCVSGDFVLLLYRHRPPNQFRWNGLGGKIESGESPLLSTQREVAEEAGLDLRKADNVQFGGVVLWPSCQSSQLRIGMYAFVARFADLECLWRGRRLTPEGDLEWRPLTWACDAANAAIVDNIPHFLPTMLQGGDPLLYSCNYDEDRLLGVEVHALTAAELSSLPAVSRKGFSVGKTF